MLKMKQKPKQQPQLRRVRKEEFQPVVAVADDPLDICLDCWKIWLAGDGDKDLGAKCMRLMTGGHVVDAWEAQHNRDNEIGAATDAMIDSLKPLHRWAIYALCSIATPWKYPNADILQVGPAAREDLREKLKKNCCTSSLF